MTEEFEFYSPVRISSGTGKAFHMDEWMKRFHAYHMLIITGKRIGKSEVFRMFTEKLNEQGVDFEIYDRAVPEPSVEAVDALAEYVRAHDFDLVTAVGGGSSMDTAKAVCMLKNNSGSIREYLFGGSRLPEKTSIPLICIPTTAGSGSEVSAASVIADTQKQVKLSCTNALLLPKAAILDPLMQTDMPSEITAGTGMDAMTHAIEAYTSRNANTFSDLYARRAIELISEYLPMVMDKPEDLHGRMMMAQASTMAAVAFLNGGLGAVHGISQAMGGIAHTPHGISNAILLPYVMDCNCSGNLNKFADIASFMGDREKNLSLEEKAHRAVELVRTLNHRIGIPNHIATLGVSRGMFPAIIKGTMEYRMLKLNPVEMTESIVGRILEESF